MRCAMGGLLCLVAFCAVSAGETAEPPPVQKVVLYKHGMGYLERQGKVKDNATVSFAFRAEQMKDLLTSFYAVDLGNGKIASVQYETRDPLSKQLQDIQINVPENAALSQFLAQLKGARLKAKAAGETVDGRILGVEPMVETVNNQAVTKGFRLVLLTDNGTIRSLDLYAITEFSLSDEALQRDLRRLLDITLDSKYTNRKKLTVSSTGQGERELRVGYLIEMPIWKCSYRVIFDEAKKDAPPLLQGWALAENTTEDDWKDISISFVAGNPLSYVMDLYSPFYVQRPRVPIPGLQNLNVAWDATPDVDAAPVALAEAQEDAAPAMARLESAKRKADFAGRARQTMDEVRAMPAAPGGAPAAAKPMADLLSQSVASMAKGVKVGELFSYEGQGKVSIPKGQAAMVPILSQAIQGQRLVYYKAAFSPKPANAFVLRNDMDLTLEAGAVTFFEGGTSLGEGILAHTLPPGSQEVVPYAIDASVDVNPQVQSRREPFFKATLVDGILTLTCTETLANTWKLVNRGKTPVTLWIDQPKNMAYRLNKPEKPLKEVDHHYRFEIPLKAGETMDFAVEEKRDVFETVHLANCQEDQIRFYLGQAYLRNEQKAFLKEVAAAMAERAEVQRQVQEWQQQSQRLQEEQRRLRDNMNSMRADRPKEQELRAKWVEQLGQAEDKLTALRGQIDEAGAKQRQLDEELAKKIRSYRDQ